jgi:hypothetical protein
MADENTDNIEVTSGESTSTTDSTTVSSSSTPIISYIRQKNQDGKYSDAIPIGGPAKNIYCMIKPADGSEDAEWVTLQTLVSNYYDFLNNGIFIVRSDTEPAGNINTVWIDTGSSQNDFKDYTQPWGQTS